MIIVYTYRIMSKQTKALMVSSGSHFMKGTGINFLRKTCKNEKNAKAKIRLKAAILRKQDIPYSVICASLDVIPSTLSYWLNRMDKEGITASHRKKYSGSRCFLNKKQLVSLRDDLISGPEKFGFNQFMWSTRMVITHVNKKYNTLYSARGMRELLHRIGFSSKKPRPTHHKSASKEEQNRFKKTQKEQSTNIPNWDTPHYVWMNQQIR